MAGAGYHPGRTSLEAVEDTEQLPLHPGSCDGDHYSGQCMRSVQFIIATQLENNIGRRPVHVGNFRI